MKAVISSINILSNRKTILLYFLIIPISNIFLLVAMNDQFGSKSNLQVVIASVIVTSVIHEISMFTSSFVYDSNIGVDRHMLSISKFSPYYFGIKAVLVFTISFVVGILNLIVVFLFSGEVELLVNGLLILVIMLIYGLVVAFTVAIASWNRINPFFWSNTVTAVLYPMSGVVVFYALYPPVFKQATYLLPFARTIGSIGNTSSNMLYDFVITIIFAIVAILLYIYKTVSIKASDSKRMM